MKKIQFVASILLIFFSFSFSASSQDSLKMYQDDVPNIFVDCRYCDSDYIRSEIKFINYVIDRNDADIHILITKERTASSGREYTLSFFGKNQFIGINDTIRYSTLQDDTDDIIRKKMVQYLNLGLMQYIVRTPLSENISIKYDQPGESNKLVDNWNYWVFRTSLRGYFNGQKSYNFYYLNLNLRADRITDDWKMRFRLGANYGEDNFKIADETISSNSRSQRFSALIVKSITNHWSVGINSRVFSSNYLNINKALKSYPALEYNMFPYSESTRSELRFLYEIGYGYFQYDEETIYDKKEEGLFEESLEITLQLNQPWGTIESSLTGSHYFFDFSKNSLNIYTELSLRIFKGFSLDLIGSYSMIHDQLSLQKSAISQEEVLLRRRQLETQYSYWGSIGVSYTFGSIYNNIVNSRFGN